MLYFVGFAAILCVWSLLLILSGERQRQMNEAMVAHPQPHLQHQPQSHPPVHAPPASQANKPVPKKK